MANCESTMSESFDGGNLGKYNHADNQKASYLSTEGYLQNGCAAIDWNPPQFGQGLIKTIDPGVYHTITNIDAIQFRYRFLNADVLNHAFDGLTIFLIDDADDEYRLKRVPFNDIVVSDTGWLPLSIVLADAETGGSPVGLGALAFRFEASNPDSSGNTAYQLLIDDICLNTTGGPILTIFYDLTHSANGIPGAIL